MKKSILSILIAAVLTTVILCGCGSSSYSTSDYSYEANGDSFASAGYDSYNMSDADAIIESPASLSAESADLTEKTSNEAESNDEKIITTVNLQAETNNFTQLSAWITERVSSLGGYIESSDEYNDYDGYKSGNFTLRIPAAQLNQFLDGISDESNITSKNISTENVTLTYVDLESHVEALKTEQARLLELMEKADTLEDLITLEDKLTDIRYELESYTSQLKVYDNRVDYSTVYVDIYEVRDYSEPTPETFWDRVETGFINTTESIVNGFEELAIFLLSALPAIILLAVIAVIVIIIIKITSKKHRNRKRTMAESAENKINTENK